MPGTFVPSMDSANFRDGDHSITLAMKILVTGGAGYIGTVLIRTLLAEGHEVVCLDPNAADISALLNLNEAERERCSLLTGDIRNTHDVDLAVSGIDSAVHLAAIVGSPACDANQEAAISTNVQGTRILARSLPKDSPFVALSTCSVYGRALNGVCRETDPVYPLTLYGETKWTAERIVTDHGGAVLRATTAYGVSPRFRWDLLIHTFVRVALTSGRLKLFEPDAIRPFIHIEDAVGALLFAIGRFGDMAGKTYNIGSVDATLSKLELARQIATLTKLEIEIDETGRDPDGRHYRVSFDQINRLGYRVARTFDSGLKDTVDWMRHLLGPERLG